MGAGKTAVLGEASDILARRNIVHAAIDLDALGLAHLSSQPSDDVMYANLRAVCRNYAATGVQRFLLARAIEDETQLKLCRESVGANDVHVCRLIAGLQTMQRRVEARDSGLLQKQYAQRVQQLNDILERARLEHFTVANDGSRLTEVATEMLIKAGWISG